MSDCESNLLRCSCGCTPIRRIQSRHPSSSSLHQQQLEDALCSSPPAEIVGLVPISKEQVGLPVESSSRSKSVETTCHCSSSRGGRFIESVQVGKESATSASSLLPHPPDNNNSSRKVSPTQNRNSNRSGFCAFCRCFLSKMLTCRMLIVLLLVKCLILSFIIPAHLIPTSSQENSVHDDGDNGDSHSGDEDGFDNIIMLDDQPLSLTLKTEIMNLVDRFDLHSQAVTNPDTTDDAGVDVPTTGDPDGDVNGNGNGHDAGTTEGDSETTGGPEKADSSNENGDKDGDDDESATGSTTATQTTTTDSTEGSSSESGSCSTSSGSMKDVLDKIETLMTAVKNIDVSIDKMETLVQSTMIDERMYKCMSAIGNGNQTQALKYWKQILRYLSTPQKQAAILNQLIRDSYGGSEDQILPVIQFIDQTAQYYGFYTLFNELPKHDHLYRNTAIFTLGHYVKKACGRDSALYKSLPGAVQSVFADFFTLQNKHNKGYLYYAKRCVAKHYFHCLDVLTKRIDPYVLDGLADDSEEKKRYHWKLNATDSTVEKFFILNHDKYWTYRLQDLNNSPRFKMEEAGSNAEVELAQFQLKLHTDDELMIQVRDSEDYLEEEDFKSDKAEVRLHSFHQADGIPDSPRMFWLVSPVASSSNDDDFDEPDSCNIDLASVTSANGIGNGNSK